MAPDDRRTRRVVGIAGSLRSGSWNRRLLEAARELAPDGLRIEPFDIRGIPLYDADLDTDQRRPDAVRRLKSAIADADGVLIASPEYNHTVPGVMQNIIDWSSRPGMRSPWAGTPVGIMGAANGLVGTARMQQVLKLTLLSTLARVMPHPGVVVGRAPDKFDADGHLADPATRDFLAAYLRQFTDWIDTVGVPPAQS
ncbi:MAG TPA: NAD(P)H-dependent oxidoreductase [Gemmatimonadaceae bacterium]|nr:NAD(P)H-dependent oxidoreductase [Gemmatimonadaceae bacterium]